MKIQRITFLGMSGIADATYDLTQRESGVPHGVVVLAGPAASGKTRILEAILATKEAIGPYGQMHSGAAWLPYGQSIARVELTVHLDEAEREWTGASRDNLEGSVRFLPDRTESESDDELGALFRRYSHAPAVGKFEYFPVARRLPALPPFQGDSAIEQRMHRCAKDARKYSFVVRFLKGLDDAPERAKEFGERLTSLSATVRYAPSARAEGLPRCLSSRGRPAGLLTDLSDSEADAVIFAATATAFSLSHSILLVDRPDLHVAPAALPALVEGLLRLGEDNQLFLTSGSEDLARAAPAALVIPLAGRG